MRSSVQRILDGKSYFMAEMQAHGFNTINTDANFIHVAFVDHADVIHNHLSDHVLYREDFSHPCLKGYSRFTMAPRDILERVVGLIQNAMKGYTMENVVLSAAVIGCGRDSWSSLPLYQLYRKSKYDCGSWI